MLQFWLKIFSIAFLTPPPHFWMFVSVFWLWFNWIIQNYRERKGTIEISLITKPIRAIWYNFEWKFFRLRFSLPPPNFWMFVSVFWLWFNWIIQNYRERKGTIEISLMTKIISSSSCNFVWKFLQCNFSPHPLFYFKKLWTGNSKKMIIFSFKTRKGNFFCSK